MHVSNLVVGLGEVGGAIFRVLSSAYPDTVGVDPQKGYELKDNVTAKFLHICIPGSCNLFEDIVIDYYNKLLPDFLIIHSSVVIGTTSNISSSIPSSCLIVFSPVNGKHIAMDACLKKHPKFIGCDNPDPTRLKEIIEMFDKCNIKAIYVGTTRSIELGKLLTTTLFGYLIAWAQEIERICSTLNVDPKEVEKCWKLIDSSDFDIKNKFAGKIGGHCVMPNIELLERFISSEMLGWIKYSNDMQLKNPLPRNTDKDI